MVMRRDHSNTRVRCDRMMCFQLDQMILMNCDCSQHVYVHTRIFIYMYSIIVFATYMPHVRTRMRVCVGSRTCINHRGIHICHLQFVCNSFASLQMSCNLIHYNSFATTQNELPMSCKAGLILWYITRVHVPHIICPKTYGFDRHEL